MKSLYFFKSFVAFVFLFQILFTVGYPIIAGKHDLFPLFTWDIFHTKPRKTYDIYPLTFLEIDHETLESPLTLVEAYNSGLLKVNVRYEILRKSSDLGHAIVNENQDEVLAITKDIEQLLLANHESIRYRLDYLKVQPREYFLYGKFNKKVPLIEKVANRAGVKN